MLSFFMKIMKTKLIALLLCVTLLCPILGAQTASASASVAVSGLEDAWDGIAAYREASCGASSIQGWIDTGLTASAGTTAEFNIIALSQSGSYDFALYEQALLAYLDGHEVYSATTREKYALALLACGSDSDYIQRVCDSDIGGQGLMSLVFGLHLLNNGCTSRLYTTDALIAAILGCQLADGGWAVIGSSGDADVTAMALQALAPHCGDRADVSATADRALSLLSSLQLGTGGFRTMGAENCESAAQVLTALCALGIDPLTDTRFIKGGNTVPDAMLSYRNADGSFAHTGSGFNESATTQAFYALRAYLRMLYGQSPLYILDHRSGVAPQPTQAPHPTQAPATAPPPSDVPATQSIEPSERQVIQTDATVIPTEPTATAEPTQPTGTAPPSEAQSDHAATPIEATVTATQASLSPATPDEASSSGGYRLYAVLGILLAAAIACAILFALKKRHIKNYLAVLILAAAAVAFVLLTNFQSKESYAQVEEKTHPVGSVTMTISCSVLADESDLPDYLPDDGVILPETTFAINEGETVYDILLEASKRCDIRIDNRGGAHSAYIAGIGFLYEFDYGELSGWMFRVNGAFPEVGCQSYVLHDGDRIEWLYTREIGRDLTPSP